MARVVLVHSRFDCKDPDSRLFGESCWFPPLNLCCLAATLRQRNHQPAIVDANALKLDPANALTQILSHNAKYVGFSSTTPGILHAAELAGLCQKAGLKTILGGVHVTAQPKAALLQFPQFDLGVLGEADYQFPELIDALERGDDLSCFPGLAYRDDGLVRETPRGSFVRGIDRLPLPAWDLLPDMTRTYQPPAGWTFPRPASVLVSSRGCSLHCIFCDRSVYGRQRRVYSPQYLFRMTRNLRMDHGIRHVVLQDDNFLYNKKYVETFCELLLESKLDLTWSCNARPDAMEDAPLALMRSAGCLAVSFGPVPASQTLLDIQNTTLKMEHLENAVRLVKGVGLRANGLFFVGSFGETSETLREAIQFIPQLPLDDMHALFFCPLPGCEAYDNVPQFGRFEMDSQTGNRFFLPKDLTVGELDQAYWRLYRAYHLRPRVIVSCFASRGGWCKMKKVFKAGLSLRKAATVPRVDVQ